MPTSKSKADTTANELAAEFAALRDDVNAILRTLKSASSDVAGDAKSAAGHAAESLRHAARDTYDGVRDRAESFEEEIVRTVKDSPIQSLALAFGVGVLISMIMRR